MQGVEFGRTAADYARHRAGFPPRFFERLRASEVVRPGERALDLGTGTGTVARGLAALGLRVVGLDPSRAMLLEARRLAAAEGVRASWVEARAEAPGLAAGAFDVVAAGQCWHWFDRPRVAAEVARLLVPGGRAVIAHFDWLPHPGNVVEATERLVLAHNPAWTGAGTTGFYPRWAADLTGAGFVELESWSFDTEVAYTHEGWAGRIRACAGVAASLPPERVAAFDRAHRAMLAERFPAEPLRVPHRVWTLVGRRPPAPEVRAG